MFLLRRAAVRAITSTPSLAVAARSRSFTSVAPSAFRSRQQQSILSCLQRRFASDDAAKKESVVDTPENFAQTAAEAPVDENVTSVPPAQRTEPTTAVESEGAGANRFSFTNKSQPRGLAPAPPATTVYVGNLFYEITDDQLQRIFSRFGEIVAVRLSKDDRGLSRGFAHVEFKTLESATAAIENLDQQVFEGRNLVVQYHRHKPRTSRIREAQRPEIPATKTLFVGNMSYEMSDKDLNDLFRDIPNVVDVRVAIDRRTGQPRGFAHAEFIDVNSATEGMKILREKVLYNRQLRVDYAPPTLKQRQRADAE